MSDAYDPDERFSLDLEPEEALKRLLGAAEGQEEVVLPGVMVPDELAPQLHELHAEVVDLAHDLGTPEIVKLGKLLREVGLLHGGHGVHQGFTTDRSLSLCPGNGSKPGVTGGAMPSPSGNCSRGPLRARHGVVRFIPNHGDALKRALEHANPDDPGTVHDHP